MQAEQDAAERHLAELNAQEAKAEEARHTPCSFEHPGTTMPGHDDSCVPITPSTITLPNGNTAQQLANGTVWATIRPAGEPINIQLSPRGPARGQFGTVIIKNLPESDIVGAPQSVQIGIRGDCQSKTYQIMYTSPYSGKMGSGMPVYPELEGGSENVLRRVEPGSLVEQVFSIVCAKEQGIGVVQPHPPLVGFDR